jgi:putative transposase
VRSDPPHRAQEPALGLPAHQRRLAKLAITVSPSSVSRVRLRACPKRRRPATGPTWREFLHAQTAGILACEFLRVDSILLRRVDVLCLSDQ